jgi:hypothetical protein
MVRWAMLLAVGLSLAMPGPASAIVVQLSGTGVATVSCADGAACDAAALPGVVTLATTNGTVTVQLGGFGSGAPALNPFDMDLTYSLTANAAAGAGTFEIAASANGLNGSILGWDALIDGNQTNGATTAFAAFADASNALFGEGTALCSAGPSGATSVHLSCSSGAFNDASFSLTEVVTINTQPGISVASGDALLTARESRDVPAVPEPTTVMLLGSALTGFAYVRHRCGRKGKRKHAG